MYFSIEEGEFIQILHTGQSHWVTISTVVAVHLFDQVVYVYNSTSFM